MKNWLVLITSIIVLGGAAGGCAPFQDALKEGAISSGWHNLDPVAFQFSKPNTSNQERDEDFKQCVRDLVIAGKDHYTHMKVRCMKAMGYSCSTDFETKGDTFYSCTH